MFSAVRAWFKRITSDPWPNAIPLPPHVKAVRIDPRLLHLHMERTAHPVIPERKQGG